MAGEDDLDIEALLSLALEEKPSDDLPERVLARVAAIGAAVDLLKLVFTAPLDALAQSDEEAPPEGGKDED